MDNRKGSEWKWRTRRRYEISIHNT